MIVVLLICSSAVNELELFYSGDTSVILMQCCHGNLLLPRASEYWMNINNSDVIFGRHIYGEIAIFHIANSHFQTYYESQMCRLLVPS